MKIFGFEMEKQWEDDIHQSWRHEDAGGMDIRAVFRKIGFGIHQYEIEIWQKRNTSELKINWALPPWNYDSISIGYGHSFEEAEKDLIENFKAKFLKMKMISGKIL